LLQPIEAAQLMLALEAVSKIPGDIAEVGSFEGVSAKLLAATDGRRTLHIFDTFEGSQEPSEKDSKGFFTGQYRASEAEVRTYLQDFQCPDLQGAFSVNRWSNYRQEICLCPSGRGPVRQYKGMPGVLLSTHGG
jgi:hypothetical protein